MSPVRLSPDFPLFRVPAAAAVVALLALGSSCAATGRPQGHDLDPMRQARAECGLVSCPVTTRELASVEELSLYQALIRVRPAMIRRSRPSFRDREGEPRVVYQDGFFQGGVSALHSLRAGKVKEVRFLSETEAFMHFGRHHRGGVIAVTTR